jgi:hypothetical protein
VLALIMATLLLTVHPQVDEKIAWAWEECHEIADRQAYDDCTIVMNGDETVMTLTYHCAVWDAYREMWILDEGPVAFYRWTADGGRELTRQPAMDGCPVEPGF